MKRVAFSTLVVSSILASAGCSGVSDPGITGNPGMTDNDSGTPDTGSTTLPGQDSSPPASDAGRPTPDAGIDATMRGSDAAPDTGSAGPPDTGSTVDTGVVDAGGGDAGATFSCGATMTCAAGAETCCVQAAGGGGGGGLVATCQTGNVCPGGGTALHCTATADCATGMECCVVGGNMGAAATSQCRAQCANVQLCDPTAADPGCPMQTPLCRPAAGGAVAGLRVPANVGTCQ